MSYIDTLNHKVLGEIAYLPVYLLEDDDLGYGNEFNSPKGTILLGGGGDDTILLIPREGISREGVLQALAQFIPEIANTLV
jgi:hypothetical protein